MNKVFEINLKLFALGYKNSKLRSQLLEFLVALKSPVSAKELINCLAEKGFKPNKTTIYRELEMLKSEGVVSEINHLGNFRLYEVINEGSAEHHHLVCNLCKVIVCYNIPEKFQQLQLQIQNNTGFRITSKIIEFSGVCTNCQSHQSTTSKN